MLSWRARKKSMKPRTRASVEVEVVYALDTRQIVRKVALGPVATAGKAVMASGLADEMPDIASRTCLARFGRLIAWDAPVQDGDRVDILRPLLADPKESRRRRALVQKAAKKRP